MVFGAGGILGRIIVEFETGILLQHVPVAFFLELVYDVIGRSGDHQRSLEFDLTPFLFQIPKHVGNDLQVSLVHHAGTHEPKIDLLHALVVRNGADCVMGVPFRDVVIVDVRVGNHGFDHLIQVHHEFTIILGVGIGS